LIDSGVVPTQSTAASPKRSNAEDSSPLVEAIRNIERAREQHQLLLSTATAAQHQIGALEARCRELADLKRSADAEAAKSKRELAELQKKEDSAGARDQEALDRLTAEKQKLSAELEQQRRQLDGQLVALKKAEKEVDRLSKDVERLRMERNRYGDEATDLRRKMQIIGGLIPEARGATPPRGEKRSAPEHEGRADDRRDKRHKPGGSIPGSPARGGPSNSSPQHSSELRSRGGTSGAGASRDPPGSEFGRPALSSPRYGPPRDPRIQHIN
jgi:hypothetical protein